MRRKPPPAECPEYGRSTGRALCIAPFLSMDDRPTQHNWSKHWQGRRQRQSHHNGESGGDGGSAETAAP